MKDIELDFDNKKIVNNFVDNQNRIAQQITVAVRSWKKDFFINENYGVNYNTCWGDPLLMKAYVSKAILNVPGVLRIVKINIVRSKDTNNKTIFKINAIVAIEKGQINISEIIGDLF